MGLVIRRKPVTAEWVIVLDWVPGVLMKVYSLRDLLGPLKSGKQDGMDFV